MRRGCSNDSLRSRREPRRRPGCPDGLKSRERMPIDPNNDPGDEMSFDAASIARRGGDEIPTVPPREVLDAVAVAAAHGAALSAEGRQIVFELLADGGVAIELRNDEGQTLNILTPSDVLDVATRGSTR